MPGQCQAPTQTYALQHWLAAQLLQLVPEADILSALQTLGYPVETAARMLAAVKDQPALQVGLLMARQLQRAQWLTQTLFQIGMDFNGQIDVLTPEAVSRDMIYRHYVATNRPVLLKGLIADWQAVRTWTPETLKARFGHCAVQYLWTDPAGKRAFETAPLSIFIDRIGNHDPENGTAYIVNGNTAANHNPLSGMLSELETLPELLDPAHPHPGDLFFGPSGTVTRLHHDFATALYCQVFGKKHFKLIDPLQMFAVYPYRNYLSHLDLSQPLDLTEYPGAKDLKPYEITVEPGDVLLLPALWWHYVVSEGISLSISYPNLYQNKVYPSFYDQHGHRPEIDG